MTFLEFGGLCLALHFGAWIGMHPVTPDSSFSFFPVPKVRTVEVSQELSAWMISWIAELNAWISFSTGKEPEEWGRIDSSVKAECQLNTRERTFRLPCRAWKPCLGQWLWKEVTVTFFPYSHIRGESGGPCKSLGGGGTSMLCTCVCTVSEPAGPTEWAKQVRLN